MSSLNFTPIHASQSKDRFNQNILLNNSNLKKNFNNNYSYNLNLNQQNFLQNQNRFTTNNINSFQNNKVNYENSFNNLSEINSFNPYYILITNLDNYTKESFYNFIAQQGIVSRDLKNIGNNKIIIKFPNQRSRNEFLENYEKVQNIFYGVGIKFIDENEKDKIINNKANMIIHNISYNNNYMNDNDTNMIQLPENKSNFQKFLDVFLNI